MLVHHHLIYQANVSPDFVQGSEETFIDFLHTLLDIIEMECLIPAHVKLSYQNAWTGLIGIITSHISFHYFVDEGYLQLDIYSCKAFDKQKTVLFLNSFWNAHNVATLFIDREIGKNFTIEKNVCQG